MLKTRIHPAHRGEHRKITFFEPFNKVRLINQNAELYGHRAAIRQNQSS
jgi:hypothetical protein